MRNNKLLSLNKDLLAGMKEAVARGGYSNQSEFARDAIRRLLLQHKIDVQRTEAQVTVVPNPNVLPIRQQGVSHEIPHMRTYPNANPDAPTRHVLANSRQNGLTERFNQRRVDEHACTTADTFDSTPCGG